MKFFVALESGRKMPLPNPSSKLWMGMGFCSDDCMKKAKEEKDHG